MAIKAHPFAPLRHYPGAVEVRGSEIDFGTKVLCASHQSQAGEGQSCGFDLGFWTIVGLYLGDGSMEKCGISISAGGNQEIADFLRNYILGSERLLAKGVVIRRRLRAGQLGNKQMAREFGVVQSWVSTCKTLLSRAEPKVCYFNRKGDIRIHNLRLRTEIESLGLGRGSHSKRVPAWVISGDRDSIAALLRGYFSADGGVRLTKNRTPSIAAFTVNYGLAEDIRALLWRLGIDCSLTCESMKASGFRPKCDTGWRVIISRIDAMRLFAEKIGLLGHRDRLARLLQRLPEEAKSKPYRPLQTRQPLRIEKTAISQPVYDLSVEGEQFLAGGVVCHNSGSMVFEYPAMRAFGLLFAGSGDTTIVSPIEYAISEARVHSFQ